MVVITMTMTTMMVITTTMMMITTTGRIVPIDLTGRVIDL